MALFSENFLFAIQVAIIFLVRFGQYAESLEPKLFIFGGGTWAESIENYFLIFFFNWFRTIPDSLINIFLLISPLISKIPSKEDG